MAFWVAMESLSYNVPIFDYYTANTHGLNVELNRGNQLNVYTGLPYPDNIYRGVYINSEKLIDWNHVLVRFNHLKGTLSVFINGVLQETKQVAAGAPNLGDILNIGFKEADATREISRYFTGYLDDIKIYNYAVSESQIPEIIGGQIILPN